MLTAVGSYAARAGCPVAPVPMARAEQHTEPLVAAGVCRNARPGVWVAIWLVSASTSCLPDDWVARCARFTWVVI